MFIKVFFLIKLMHGQVLNKSPKKCICIYLCFFLAVLQSNKVKKKKKKHICTWHHLIKYFVLAFSHTKKKWMKKIQKFFTCIFGLNNKFVKTIIPIYLGFQNNKTINLVFLKIKDICYSCLRNGLIASHLKQ